MIYIVVLHRYNALFPNYLLSHPNVAMATGLILARLWSYKMKRILVTTNQVTSDAYTVTLLPGLNIVKLQIKVI